MHAVLRQLPPSQLRLQQSVAWLQLPPAATHCAIDDAQVMDAASQIPEQQSAPL
jgi:hypothetical protein